MKIINKGENMIDETEGRDTFTEVTGLSSGDISAPAEPAEVPDAIVGGTEGRITKMKESGTFDPTLDERMAKGVEKDNKWGTPKEFNLPE